MIGNLIVIGTGNKISAGAILRIQWEKSKQKKGHAKKCLFHKILILNVI
jgi:hypothetical protein